MLLGMLPIKSTTATYTERTIRKKSCLKIYYITHKNIFKFILKFYFLFEVSSPAIPPPPNENFKNSPFPLFFFPPFFGKSQLPPDFIEFKNPVPPPS